MKIKSGRLLAAAVVLLALAFPVTTPANPPERHPEIRAAMASLRRAKEYMEHADHDFGGHRVEAIRATDEAMRQLDLCLKYDRH
jgi:hypothetical protein